MLFIYYHLFIQISSLCVMGDSKKNIGVPVLRALKKCIKPPMLRFSRFDDFLLSVINVDVFLIIFSVHLLPQNSITNNTIPLTYKCSWSANLLPIFSLL